MKSKLTDKFGLPDGTIENIINILKKNKDIQRALIYGSRAMGNYKPTSDIDITLDSPRMSLNALLKIENKDLLDHINRMGVVFYP